MSGAFTAASISTSAAPVPLDEAAELVLAEYGITAEPGRLIGERDQNFAMRTPAGPGFALKLIHPAEDPAVTNFQTAVLLRLAEADPPLPTQRVVPTRDGLAEKPVILRDGTSRMMRLTTFLPGAIIRGLPASPARSRDLGRMLARIQHALDGLTHPADRHEVAWDIRLTARQRAVLPEIAPPARRALVAAGLDRFDRHVAPVMDGLRAQVVHNDLSGDNVVVDPATPDRVAGVLDFGDATRTAVANDVAIGMAYTLTERDDPLADGLPFLAGFHAVKPILPNELDLLHDLLIARMVIRVCITEWRARRFPDNRDYILRNTPLAWHLLDALLRLPPARARAAFHDTCPTETA